MLGICLLGAGRIGAVHAKNLVEHPQVKLLYVVDVDESAAKRLADLHRCKASTTKDDALRDPNVHAVVIATSTDTHVDYIVAAAKAQKAIFCEKPIDLDLERTISCLNEVEKHKTPLFIGFNRRFDTHFARVKKAMHAGEIGALETVVITSRDPAPPPAAYVKRSGGLFRDMMIHDFDMARFLLAEEPVEIFATGSCLVDPGIGKEGDVDTAMVVMKTAKGVLCHINNSRRAVYGYDQRVEVLGSKGMLRAENPLDSTVQSFSDQAPAVAKLPYFFIERYMQAYRHEIDHFITSIVEKTPLAVTGFDGQRALVLANAAVESLKTGRSIHISN